jgi:hypothetical protein
MDVAPLREDVSFGRGRYDIGAVDAFLDHMVGTTNGANPVRTWAGQWSNAPMGNWVQGDQVFDAPSSTGRISGATTRRRLIAECAAQWRDLPNQSGTLLQFRRTRGTQCELRTAEGALLVMSTPSPRAMYAGADGLVNIRRPFVLTCADKTYTLRRGQRSASTLQIAALAEEWINKLPGHFSRSASYAKYRERMRKTALAAVRELVDDQTDEVIFYRCGQNVYGRASALIAYDDARRLSFPVRGTRRSNAVMAAVDECGATVARFRSTDRRHLGVDIKINPDISLSDDLKLAVSLAAPMLPAYFASEAGGGG